MATRTSFIRCPICGKWLFADTVDDNHVARLGCNGHVIAAIFDGPKVKAQEWMGKTTDWEEVEMFGTYRTKGES